MSLPTVRSPWPRTIARCRWALLTVSLAACTTASPPSGDGLAEDGSGGEDDDGNDESGGSSSSDEGRTSTNAGATTGDSTTGPSTSSSTGPSTSSSSTSTGGGSTTGASAGDTTSTSTSGDPAEAGDDSDSPLPSTGCGATPPASGRFDIDVDGTTREYILKVPDDYDPNHPYPIVFAWHPRGGSAEQVATGFGGGYYGLESLANGSAIFVSPEGIDAGWANPGGRDIAFTRAMIERFTAELCIDESRLFSTGFSYGGMMSFAIACELGDLFRAIAPMSGALYSGCMDRDFPIAMMGWHGDDDEIVPLSDGEAGRDVVAANNHCDGSTVPHDVSPCVEYTGCDEGYPTVWCEFQGGHTPAQNAAQPIWAFFSQF